MPLRVRKLDDGPMKTKIVLSSIVVVLVLAGVAAAVWWLERPQVITFGDGSKVTLLAVEYGKKHAPPAAKASGSTNRTAGRRGNSFTTTNDTLVVWVRQEYDAKQGWHNFQYFIY